MKNAFISWGSALWSMGGSGGAMVDIVTPDCFSLAQSFDERQGVLKQYVTARFQKDINGSKPPRYGYAKHASRCGRLKINLRVTQHRNLSCRKTEFIDDSIGAGRIRFERNAFPAAMYGVEVMVGETVSKACQCCRLILIGQYGGGNSVFSQIIQ